MVAKKAFITVSYGQPHDRRELGQQSGMCKVAEQTEL
jgi:hypothetical protein